MNAEQLQQLRDRAAHYEKEVKFHLDQAKDFEAQAERCRNVAVAYHHRIVKILEGIEE